MKVYGLILKNNLAYLLPTLEKTLGEMGDLWKKSQHKKHFHGAL